ncbi:class I SAM-dependent methyltransferase [Streptomyces sp. NPDC048182]|uniref:class I SAM-dependent methyltransferase n=1 Tax=Streptomyces sp. NPDC048182 TaxID=3365507 RepID=UPI0037200FC0
MTTGTADLWHHYGRARAQRDRAVPGVFSWSWDQNGGPGAEVLGDLTGRCVGDLGAGTARHAAHLVVHHRPARVDAVDASPAQHAMARGLYGRLAPALRIVHSDVTRHLRAKPGEYDVLYSVFGAACFSDPGELMPAAAAALRPGGKLVVSTLAHHLSGESAQPDVLAADIPARTPDGEAATMRRWVLQDKVWVKVLGSAGFSRVDVRVLRSSTEGPRAADTLLVTAHAGV